MMSAHQPSLHGAGAAARALSRWVGISASKIKPTRAPKRSQRDSTGRIYRQPPQACISDRSSDIPRVVYGIAARGYDTRVPFAPRARHERREILPHLSGILSVLSERAREPHLAPAALHRYEHRGCADHRG